MKTPRKHWHLSDVFTTNVLLTPSKGDLQNLVAFFSTMPVKDSVKFIFTCNLELRLNFIRERNLFFAKKLHHRCLTGPRRRPCCIARKWKLFLNYFEMSPVN